MSRKRRFPGKRFVDPLRLAFTIHEQVFRSKWISKMRPCKRLAGLYMFRSAMRPWMGRRRFRIRRLVTMAARAIDGADDRLQNMQCTRRLETIRMGGDAAHGMKAHRPSDHDLVLLALHVGPRLLEDNLFLKRHAGDFRSQSHGSYPPQFRFQRRPHRAHISDRDIFLPSAAGHCAPSGHPM